MSFHVGIPMFHIYYKNLWFGFQFGLMSYVSNYRFWCNLTQVPKFMMDNGKSIFFYKIWNCIHLFVDKYFYMDYLSNFVYSSCYIGFLKKWSFNQRLNGTMLLALVGWEWLLLVVFQPNIVNTFQHTQSWCQIQQILIENLCVEKIGNFLLICLKFENNHALTLPNNEKMYFTFFVHSWPQTLVIFFLIFGYCKKKLHSLY